MKLNWQSIVVFALIVAAIVPFVYLQSTHNLEVKRLEYMTPTQEEFVQMYDEIGSLNAANNSLRVNNNILLEKNQILKDSLVEMGQKYQMWEEQLISYFDRKTDSLRNLALMKSDSLEQFKSISEAQYQYMATMSDTLQKFKVEVGELRNIDSQLKQHVIGKIDTAIPQTSEMVKDTQQTAKESNSNEEDYTDGEKVFLAVWFFILIFCLFLGFMASID